MRGIGAASLACAIVAAAGKAVDCDASPESVVPQGVHLAYAGDSSTRMAVSFFTCADGGVPIVEVFDSDGSVKTIEGASSQYYQRRHHDIVITELSPKTSYEYVVGFKGAKARSAKFAFKTAPGPGDDVVFKAAVIGDMGVNNSAGTIARLAELAPELNLTIHLGDVAYADDCNVPLHIEPSAGRSYEAVYDLYQQSVEAFAAAAPYMVMPGNHDVSCHAVQGDLGCPKELRNFSAFRYRFRMPSIESGATSLPHHNMWHSWRVGNVHFVALSSESDFPGAPTTPSTKIGGGAGGGFDGDQLSWLRRDLAEARSDPSVKWVVAMAHRPWYATSKTDWPLLAPGNLKKAFEPLLQEFGVDIWLCGHQHYYERTVAAYNGKADPEGAVQIINGAAGNNEGIGRGGGVGGLTVAANYDEEGYGELSQLNATALRWRYILSADGSVVDELVLEPRPKRHVV